MKKHLYIFLVLISESIFSQNTFLSHYNQYTTGDKIYTYNRGQILLETEDGYMVIGYKQEKTLSEPPFTQRDTTRPMIFKVDKHGNMLWNKRYDNKACDFSINSIIKNSNKEYLGVGGTYMPGDSCGYFVTTPVDLQLYMQKINENGDLIWQKSIGESVNKTGQLGIGITSAKDLNYLVLGSDDNYPWLLKINEVGDTLWTKKYNSLNGQIPAALYSIQSGYLIFSVTYTTTYISKINEQGDLLWTKNFPYRAEVLIQNNKGGFTLSRNEKPSIQVFTILTQIDNDANVLWESSYPIQGVWALCETTDKNYIIASKDFAKVAPSGEVLWNKRFFGNSNINPSYYYLNVIATSDGGYLTTGLYQNHTFLIKTDCNGNLEWDNSSCLLPTDKNTLIFPNPFTDVLTIQLPSINKNSDKINLQLTNGLGQIIFKEDFYNQNIFTLNTSTISHGIYFITVVVNNSLYSTQKIVKY